MDDTDSKGGSLSFAKTLRLVRLAKMLRVARLKRIVGRHASLVEFSAYVSGRPRSLDLVALARGVLANGKSVAMDSDELDLHLHPDPLPGTPPRLLLVLGRDFGGSRGLGGAQRRPQPHRGAAQRKVRREHLHDLQARRWLCRDAAGAGLCVRVGDCDLAHLRCVGGRDEHDDDGRLGRRAGVPGQAGAAQGLQHTLWLAVSSTESSSDTAPLACHVLRRG